MGEESSEFVVSKSWARPTRYSAYDKMRSFFCGNRAPSHHSLSSIGSISSNPCGFVFNELDEPFSAAGMVVYIRCSCLNSSFADEANYSTDRLFGQVR